MYWNATVMEFEEGYKVILALSRVVSPQFKNTLPGSNYLKWSVKSSPRCLEQNPAKF